MAYGINNNNKRRPGTGGFQAPGGTQSFGSREQLWPGGVNPSTMPYGAQLNAPGWSSVAPEWSFSDLASEWSEYGAGLGGMYDAWQAGYFDPYLSDFASTVGGENMGGWEDWSFTDVVNWFNNNPGAPGGGWSQYYGGTGMEGGGSPIGGWGDLGEGSITGDYIDPYIFPDTPQLEGETYEIEPNPYMEGDKYQEGGPYFPPGGDECYNQWLATQGVGYEGSYDEFAGLYC
jgi:hypothetical protein